MDKMKMKLDDIIDFTLVKDRKVWDNAEIEAIASKNGMSFSSDYTFFLKYYGNNYIKDDYLYTPTYHFDSNEDAFDIGGIFGLYEDSNNLENESMSFLGIIPNDLFPIADLHGGDLICMGKEDCKIYFWYHDKVDENVFLVDDNFESFIMNFHFQDSQNGIDLDKVELNFDSDLDQALRNAAKKYK